MPSSKAIRSARQGHFLEIVYAYLQKGSDFPRFRYTEYKYFGAVWWHKIYKWQWAVFARDELTTEYSVVQMPEQFKQSWIEVLGGRSTPYDTGQ